MCNPLVYHSVNDITCATCFCGRLVNQLDLPPACKLDQFTDFTPFPLGPSIQMLLLIEEGRKPRRTSKGKGKPQAETIDIWLTDSRLSVFWQLGVKVKLLSISYGNGDICPTIALKTDWEILGLALIAVKLFLTQNCVWFTIFVATKKKRRPAEIGSKFSHLACQIKWKKLRLPEREKE